nr:DUF11 domain-containing protein [Streptomyces sp. FBKL.4005]
MVKAADATTVTVGQTVTYRVTVINTGPNHATGVTVADPLPEGLVFLSAEAASGAYDPAAGQWAVGDLAEGAGVSLTLRAKATRPGPVTNTATVTAAPPPPRRRRRAAAVGRRQHRGAAARGGSRQRAWAPCGTSPEPVRPPPPRVQIRSSDHLPLDVWLTISLRSVPVGDRRKPICT